MARPNVEAIKGNIQVSQEKHSFKDLIRGLTEENTQLDKNPQLGI